MRILVATADTTFNVALTAAYRARGWDVHVGQSELFLRQLDFDLVHFHWPEELVGWKVPPSPSFVQRTLDMLDWWKGRAKLVCTVHNLLPHNMAAHDRETRAYYLEFYRRMHGIGHFSEASLKAVKAAFPELAGAHHFVHGMNLFDNLRPLATGRDAARARFGLRPDEFVIAIMGAIRRRQEFGLLARGIDGARVRCRVLLGTGVSLSRRPILRQWQQARFDRWMQRHECVRLAPVLQDDEMVALLDACDGLALARYENNLNSGLLPLAMTFGTPLIAPDYGVFSETLGDGENFLYQPGNASGMAEAIDRLARADRQAVIEQNRMRAAEWGWDTAINRILSNVALA